MINQHDLHALVSTRNTTNHSPDVLDTFSEVTGICYMASATVCIVLASVVTIGIVKSSDIRIYSLKLGQVLWSSVETILDQENFTVTQLSSRIGWWIMCVAIFVPVYGYILNLITTDIAVPDKPKVINEIDDFFEPEFEFVQPVIFTTFWFLNRLVSEPSETKLGRLYRNRMLKVHVGNQCHKDGDDDFFRCSIIDLNVDSPTLIDDSISFVKQISDGKKALLTEKEMYYGFKEAGCALQPKVLKSLHLSEASFATGTIATVMRSDLPLAFRQYYAYRSRSMYLEAGLLVLIVRKALREEAIAKLGYNPFDWKFEKCMINIFDDESVNDDRDLIQLPLKSLRTLTNFIFALYVISVCLLMVEVGYSRIMRLTQKAHVLDRPKVINKWIKIKRTELRILPRNVCH